jgi:hypothetical protein
MAAQHLLAPGPPEFPMKKRLVLLCFLFMSAGAFAHNCPNEMKAIDLKLTGSPKLSSADMGRVMTLRTDGEKLHKEGKHADSMKALAEAKKLLGM